MAREPSRGRGREELLARLAARAPRSRRSTRRLAAILLGWLVLMTVWGFGRAWHGGFAPVEFVVGLVGGVLVTVVAWRRAGRDRS